VVLYRVQLRAPLHLNEEVREWLEVVREWFFNALNCEHYCT
jgi:hypothetical protein